MLTILLGSPSRRSLVGLIASLATATTLLACGDDDAPVDLDATVADARSVGDEPDAADDEPDAADDEPDGATPVDPTADARPADPSDCALPLPCPAPQAGKISICGQLRDLASDAPIAAAAPTGTACDASDPTATGPCSLELTFYDALAFVGNPTGAAPLPADEIVVDDCGRFRAENLSRPDIGFVGVAIDDADAEVDAVARTASMVHVTAGGIRRDYEAHVLASATDAAWQASANLDGPSFEARGAYVAIFRLGGVPRAGVTITRLGNPQGGRDHYFSDAEATARTTIDGAMTATGTNGTGVLLDSTAVQHGATGGNLPQGCVWPSTLAAALPGLIFVGVYEAERTASGTPCD